MFREERGTVRPLRKFWPLLGALALGFLLVAPAEAASRQETWVLQQVAAGRVADLKKQFGDKEEDRKLSAAFLVDLLTGAYKVQRKGVMITNAVIAEPLDLEMAHVPHPVWLFQCRFQDDLKCQDAVFENHFLISGSHFEKAADFEWLKVKLSFFCRDAIFQGPVNFFAANIEGQLIAIGAQFQGKGKDNQANFNSLKVGQHALFENAIFQGPVDFTAANIGDEFSAKAAQFQGRGPDNRANFNSLKVGRLALFENAIFQGPVDFVGANIGGQFIANGAQFKGKGKDNKADFDGLKVGESAFFDKAIFQGPVDFVGANIEGFLSARLAQFQGQGKDNLANFNGLKVGESAFFDQAIFQGPVYFTTVNIDGQFSARRAEFRGEGEDNPAIFNSLKVGQAAFFDNATFKGPVDFGYADIGLGIILTGAKFNSEGPVTFQGMKVGQHAFFNLAEFYGPVDLSFCTFQALDITGIILSTQKDAINLEGLIYKSISAGDEPDDWKKLLALVDQARYHAQPYSQLETFLKESGYPDRANEVFIAKKRREMKETWHWCDYWKWPFEKGFLDWGVGYGRHPERAFYPCFLFIMLGWLVFSRPGVLIRKDKDHDPRIGLWEVLWFSLNAFVPVVKLGPEQLYEVDQDKHLKLLRMRAQTYFYWHQIFGYIFVSIGVAAVTGIIK